MKKAEEILARLLEKGPAGAPAFHSLFGGWQEIAGPSLAEHCRAYEVRHHSLLVEADHPGWMQLFLMQKKPILARIRQRFPQLDLRDIKVRVNAAGARCAAARWRRPARRLRRSRCARGQAPPGPGPAERGNPGSIGPGRRPGPPGEAAPAAAGVGAPGRRCAGLTLLTIDKYTPLSYSIRENYL
jgi:hypothetical protein